MEKLNLSQFKDKRMTIDEMGAEGMLAGGSEKCTKKQRGYIYGMLKRLDRDITDYLVSDIHDLTIIEANALIDIIKEDYDMLMYSPKKDSFTDNEFWENAQDDLEF